MEVKLQHCLQHSSKITAPPLNERRIGNNKNLYFNRKSTLTSRDVFSLCILRVMTSSVLKAKTATWKLSLVICSAPEVKGFLT